MGLNKVITTKLLNKMDFENDIFEKLLILDNFFETPKNIFFYEITSLEHLKIFYVCQQ